MIEWYGGSYGVCEVGWQSDRVVATVGWVGGRVGSFLSGGSPDVVKPLGTILTLYLEVRL